MRKVCVVLTARPSWAKLQTLCAALRDRAELQLVVCASALLERYGNVSQTVEAQGFTIAERVYSVVEGATHETAAIEGGVLKSALGRTYARLKPDVVVVCADRHEIEDAASAARNLEIPIAHLQGGEVSGSVDHDIRNAVSCLATYHLVATRRAAFRVYGLTGSDQITVTGCPSIDIAKQARDTDPVTALELGGAGEPIDLSKPFVVVLQHPVTDEMADAAHQMQVTLDAVREHKLPALVLWPGQDAGHDAMAKVIRMTDGIHTVRNLPPARFLKLLTQCSALVGNSSAGIREASYLGTPVINIGSRQTGRERGPNVRDVPSGETLATIRAIYDQVTHGPFKSSTLYGKGDSGERIAEVLCGR
jgi:UDP-hydrolysing UDP-N-acetyl-D-glucosamine 2-epimerase